MVWGSFENLEEGNDNRKPFDSSKINLVLTLKHEDKGIGYLILLTKPFPSKLLITNTNLTIVVDQVDSKFLSKPSCMVSGYVSLAKNGNKGYIYKPKFGQHSSICRFWQILSFFVLVFFIGRLTKSRDFLEIQVLRCLLKRDLEALKASQCNFTDCEGLCYNT